MFRCGLSARSPKHGHKAGAESLEIGEVTIFNGANYPADVTSAGPGNRVVVRRMIQSINKPSHSWAARLN